VSFSGRNDENIDRRQFLRFGSSAILATSLGLFSVQGVNASAIAHTRNGVVLWNEALLQAIRAERVAPSVTARAAAILHTAIYDAWAAYDRAAVGVYLGKQYRRPTTEHTSARQLQALSYAAYRTLVDLFPASTALFQSVMRQLGYDPSRLSLDARTAIGIGNLAAQALLSARHKDGANQLGDLHPGAYSDYTGYMPVNSFDHLVDPARWQPLRVPNGRGGFVLQSFTTPQWGRVLPFALKIPTQLLPASTLPAVSSQDYLKQAQQMLAYSAHLTDTQKTIADYWHDGPGSEQPPGHWLRFAQYISLRDAHTLEQDVKLFFVLSNALLDASILCWTCKSVFDSVRPITAIRYLFAGKKVYAWAGPHQGTRLIEGQSWQPYQPATFITPSFPEFCSGHSTFSAAGALVLRRFTGSDHFGATFTRLAGTSPLEPGTAPATDITLSWATFSEAADQAGLSRRYGGIHFPNGDLTGRALGRSVGDLVWQKAQTYITGS
jgi:hypothetical protein